MSVATGVQFFPSFRPTRHGRVMFLAGEDPAGLVWRSMASFAARIGVEDDLVDYALRDGILLRALSPIPFLTATPAGKVERTEAFGRLLRDCRRFQPALIVVDTARKHLSDCGLSENDSAVAGAFLQACIDLGQAANGAVLLTAHLSKASPADSGNRGAHAVRGSSAMTDEARSVLLMEREGALLRVRHTKSNYARASEDIRLEFKSGGALAEVVAPDPAPALDPKTIAEAITWFAGTHPKARLTPGGLKTRQGDGALVWAALEAKHPGADLRGEDFAAGLELALKGGSLRTRDTVINGKTRTLLELAK